MLHRAIMLTAVAWALSGPAFAETASPEEVARAYHMFFPAAVDLGPVGFSGDLSAAIAKGLDGDWYRADILGSIDPDIVRTACSRGQSRISTAPNEITLVQQSKPAPVTYRYTYVGGSLFSEWVDLPALFARLGLDKMPDEEKRRQTELSVLRSHGGFVVMVRASANILWMYSLAGGPRLYARCG
jgi:hypothetical protein